MQEDSRKLATKEDKLESWIGGVVGGEGARRGNDSSAQWCLCSNDWIMLDLTGSRGFLMGL